MSPWSGGSHGVLVGTLPDQIPRDLPRDQEMAERGFSAPGGQHRRQPTHLKGFHDAESDHLMLVN
jgi:hypothetical protein